jgi:hypothetical protein
VKVIEPIYTVKAVCELFHVKDPRTARKIMREMEHTENPLLVTERAVKAWLEKKTLPPESEMRRILRTKGA